MSTPLTNEQTATGKVEGLLAELARVKRKLATIDNQMNEQIDVLKTRAALESAGFVARVKEIDAEITLIVKMNKREIFTGNRKSREFAFGIVGYRKGSGKISQRNKVKVPDVLKKLHEYGLTDAIKTKESLNLDAMKGWTDDRLESVGMRRSTREKFFIEVKSEQLPTA